MKNPETCFVIMPFKEPLNSYYRSILIPAIKKANFKPVRGDNVYGTRSIIKDIIYQIQNSKILIADLTGKNPNVVYELGIAHCFSKPVIILVQSLEDVPFDLQHLRILKYDTTQVKWNVKLKDDIVNTIAAVMDNPGDSIAFEVNHNNVLPHSLKKLLLNSFKEFEGTISSREALYFDEMMNCTLTKERYQVANTDISHLMIDSFLDKKGKVEIMEAVDTDTQKELDVFTCEEYEKGKSSFLIFEDIKKKGSSFNYRIKFTAENYLSDLVDKGIGYRRITPIQKMKFDSIEETYYLPDDKQNKNLTVSIERHPDAGLINKKIDCTIIGKYKVFSLLHNLANFPPSEIVIKFAR